MHSRNRLHATLFISFFLIGVGAQAARLLTPFGANMNFFMAGLPSLALIASPGAFALSALLAATLLKTIPVFELSSLALGAIAIVIFFARRLPLHPFILHPMLSVAGAAAFYAVMDRTFFAARDILLAEFLAIAVLSFVFTLLTSYVRR